MKPDSVRTAVDIPAPLYRKLEAQAAAKGCSVRELVLAGIRRVLVQGQRPRPMRVQFPLIVSDGPKVNLANEQIYEHVEFPWCKRVAGEAAAGLKFVTFDRALQARGAGVLVL